MKILCVIQRFYPVIGGGEIYTKHLLDYLSKKHKISVFTTNASDIHAFWNKNAEKILEDPINEYPIKRFEILTPSEFPPYDKWRDFPLASNYPGPFSPDLWIELVTEKIDFDLIIGAGYPYDHILPAFFASKKWNIPLILIPFVHSEFPELHLTGFRLNILKNSDAITVLSNSEKKILIENGITSEKIKIITPGVNTKEISDPIKFKKQNLIDQATKLILFVGLKSKEKGLFTLIEAMKKVWRIEPNTKLILIGPSTPEFINYFSNLNHNFKKKIIDLGIVDETTKNTAMSICDIFTIPSKSESFGMVILEAWYYKKPVISTNISPINEIITNKKNGILVNYNNVDELFESIVLLIKNDKLKVDLGKKGFSELKKYDWNKSNIEFEEICNNIIKN